MSDIYLSITETPTVVTLTNPLISSNVAQSVTVTNVVSVNVVTMPAITVQAAAPAVTTVAGTVSISNFPSTQTIAGTVTANGIQLQVEDALFGSDQLIGALNSGLLLTANVPISGTVTANVGNSVTVGAIVGPSGGSCLKAISPSGDAVRSLLLTKDGGGTYGELSGSGVGIFNLPVYGTITVGNSVTIGSLPAISGTVTANGGDFTAVDGSVTIPARAAAIGFYDTAGNGLFKLANSDDQLFPVRVANGDPLPISGTVTANTGVEIGTTGNSHGFIALGIDDVEAANPLLLDGDGRLRVKAEATTVTIGSSVTIGSLPAISGTVTVGAISTSVTARLVDSTGTAVSYAATGSAGTPSTDVISVQGVSGGTSLPISGTAGTLTTRFGSVTTANTAQISSAVTNTSRKYLLIQNVTTSSNVITIGIGFTPTTTQGIQLTAGAGITFESSYIPTGAVYVLSGVTASPFTILEA